MAAPSLSALLAAPQSPAGATGQSRSAAQIRRTAEEFESVFLGNVFQTMFSGLDGDGPLGGEGGAIYRSMLGEEYAKTVSANGGIGLSDQIQRELLSMQEAIR
jgi:Rod binding domain-containing protein